MSKLVYRVTYAGRTFTVRRPVRMDSMSNFVEDSLSAACELGSLFNLPGEAFKVSLSEGEDNGDQENAGSESPEKPEAEAGAEGPGGRSESQGSESP